MWLMSKRSASIARLRNALSTEHNFAKCILHVFLLNALQRSYTEKADVWAIGVCLYILLCGKPPFEHALDDEIFRMIVDNGVPDFSYHAWDNITEPAKVRRGLLLCASGCTKDDDEAAAGRV
jgi:serine/threonine protein kinase